MTPGRIRDDTEITERTPYRILASRHDGGLDDMNIRPLHDRVIVRRLEGAADSKVGSIIIPDSAKEKPQQGEVVAVGSGALLETGERGTVDVQPGNRILFGKYGGAEVKLEGEEYLILREDEILAIID